MDWDALLQQLTGGGDAYRVARAVVQLESRGNPNSTNTLGNVAGKDWGLFQLNDTVGQGVGMTAAQMLDPETNVRRGLPSVLATTKKWQAAGYSGFDLLQRVISDRASGHPALASQSMANKQAAWNLTGGATAAPQPGSAGPVALPGLAALPGLPTGATGGTSPWAVLGAGGSAAPGETLTVAGDGTPAGEALAASNSKSLLDWVKNPLPDLTGAAWTGAGLLGGVLLLILGVVLLGFSFSGGNE